MRFHPLILMLWLVAATASHAQRICLDADWLFAYGDASSAAKDFGCGTEYFNYLTKANSIHNEGPYSTKFDERKWGKAWKRVSLPHDWVVDLPFAPEASHSHGYKTVGYKYPETSVGWYRKTFTLGPEDAQKHIYIQFDGIFRNAQVWVNGFYCGHEPSGYATQVYDITDYILTGKDEKTGAQQENLVCVRVDATLEEGWFYEGAGIYRHVWLVKEAPLHIAPFGIFAHSALKDNYTRATLTIETDIVNDSHADASATVLHELVDKNGTVIATAQGETQGLIKPRTHAYLINGMEIDRTHLWTTDTPYLYTLRSMVVQNGKTLDTRTTRIGIREAKMDKDKGFLLNGKPLKIKGVNMHQDHAGVGAAIPDELQVYRLLQLKKFGCNAYRSSHNPMTPELLDACDSLGILVLEENRLTGINTEHTDLLRRMIVRDRNHPCIFAWSSGNEEWGLEWDARGEKVIRTMCEYAHQYDPTRPVAVATSSGPSVLLGADISGYNYVMQNPIDRYRRDYPTRLALGSEETTGCGTRGCYFDDTDNGHMTALNRTPDTAEQPDNHLGSGCINRIERGWKFYDERPWLGGLFYWTGFDYRGEANPLKYPATGSEFGILDYCGFAKDEAYYLKAWWTDEPVLHLLPHWNLNEEPSLHSTPSPKVDVWAYSNCDEVELFVNGKSAGRKKMEKNGHLEWSVVYNPGTLKAVGYKNGKRQLTETIETASAPTALKINEERIGTLAILNIDVIDKKGRPVPTACIPIDISISGCAQILGVGNGDPAWRAKERPDSPDEKHFQMRTFNGKAQVILKVPNNEYAYEVNLKNRKITESPSNSK